MYKKIQNRPLTPHLTIYSSQVTSVYSIWHRITGLSLIFALALYLSFLKFNSYFICELEIKIDVWVQNSFFLILTIFFYYHVLNGIRHISWDLGFILPINTVLNSARFLSLALFCYFVILVLKIVN